jgi:hypothetical protein
MQAHALPIGVAERTFLVPDEGRDGDAAEVVQQTRAVHGFFQLGAETQSLGGELR